MANQNLHNRMASGLSPKPEITVDKLVGCINPNSCIHLRWETSVLRISLWESEWLFTFLLSKFYRLHGLYKCQDIMSVIYLCGCSQGTLQCLSWSCASVFLGCKLVSGHFNPAVHLLKVCAHLYAILCLVLYILNVCVHVRFQTDQAKAF